MKASMSLGMEFEIALSPQEVSDLEKKSLTGTVKAYNNLPGVRDEEVFNPRSLLLKIGETGENLFANLQSFPKGADPLSHRHYIINLSQEAYEQLKERGETGDRIRSNIKVSIYDVTRHRPY